MHEKNIDKIIKEGSQEQMIMLKDWVLDLINEMETEDETVYLKYCYELHKILYGCHMSQELADDWVSKMKNKDGTHGAHWTYEQTSQVMKDKGIKVDACDWYVVMNMVYSDFYNARYDTSDYVALAKDWLMDEDAQNGKLLKYYFYVVKHD